jgi:hypothetical protein
VEFLLFTGDDHAPDSALGAGRLAVCSIEPPELDESNSVALCLPTVVLGSFWDTGVSSPDLCALVDASASVFLFFWAMMSLELSQDVQ